MHETTIRLRCTFADQMLLERKGTAQWKALVEGDAGDTTYSLEMVGSGENPYTEGQVYRVIVVDESKHPFPRGIHRYYNLVDGAIVEALHIHDNDALLLASEWCEEPIQPQWPKIEIPTHKSVSEYRGQIVMKSGWLVRYPSGLFEDFPYSVFPPQFRMVETSESPSTPAH